jgi:hypothetical protein
MKRLTRPRATTPFGKGVMLASSVFPLFGTTRCHGPVIVAEIVVHLPGAPGNCTSRRWKSFYIRR